MKTAIIIGAGPAGLTAAYELLDKTDIIPIIIESDNQVRGHSKTIDYKGNKIDIGGHRFFSKSQKVINWWLSFLPLEPDFNDQTVKISYHQKDAEYLVAPQTISDANKVMLVRKRKSRVYYHKKLFDYPLQLTIRTLRKLGLIKSVRIFLSYFIAKIAPRKPEVTLEHFFRNRFGKELYETFFKDYTEKVWGVPCTQIPASWGKQRVKNLNVGKLVRHFIKTTFSSNRQLDQKGTSTSLIEQFLYPKFGPGQLWETVAEEIIKKGGRIILNAEVTKLYGDHGNNLIAIEKTDLIGKQNEIITGDYFFSTMPVKDLVNNITDLPVPENVRTITEALEYRDFLIVGILTSHLSLSEHHNAQVTDNWIYVQDKQIGAGRLQFFHNWSPAMVAEQQDKWIGVEYFCDETDSFWNTSDNQIKEKAIAELEKMGILQRKHLKDAVVVRVKKAYPSYYGSYRHFSIVQTFLNNIENLFPIGRNGMHRYNNSDHSMLTAMAAVENIMTGKKDKSNIWEINTEEEYHEEVDT